MTKVTTIFLATVISAACFSSIIAFQIYRVSKTPPAAFSPQQLTYTQKPPSRAITGKVSQVSGKVQKTPRDQVDAVDLTQNMDILEGESVTAGTGEASLQFGQAKITIKPSTTMSFSSTDPAHFLVGQDAGSVSYQTDEKTQTISVRALDGLFAITKGAADLTSDPETDTLHLSVTSGAGKFGYINTENKTQVVEIQSGQSLAFDSTKRTVTVK